mmetsp:Transcript_8279/g.15068  ORF Transcript_8279/g.15068 Transcript_8279/m.15068 type:complete len:114 (+) Transcript_8279:75-416(+)
MPGYHGPSGETEAYRWANIGPGHEVEVEFDLPENCKARDVEVKIKADNVFVRIAGKVAVHSDLLNRCDPDESWWEVRGTRLVVILQKASGSTIPWPNVFLQDCKQTVDIDDLL